MGYEMTELIDTPPFYHALLDGAVPQDILQRQRDVWPSSGWTVYDNPLEKKRVWNAALYAYPISQFFGSRGFLDKLTEVTGIPDLRFDPTYYGAGLSCMRRGDYLKLHRDLELHPETGLERRVNLALFLTPRWDKSWGGGLQLWAGDDSPVSSNGLLGYRSCFLPLYGRVVLFSPDIWHGIPDPIGCPDYVERRSLQLFFYSTPRAAVGRRSAEFAGRTRGESDWLLNDFRKYCRVR